MLLATVLVESPFVVILRVTTAAVRRTLVSELQPNVKPKTRLAPLPAPLTVPRMIPSAPLGNRLT